MSGFYSETYGIKYYCKAKWKYKRKPGLCENRMVVDATRENEEGGEGVSCVIDNQ